MNDFLIWLRAKAPDVLALIWQGLTNVTRSILASLAALLASPAVWLACGVVFVAGFSLGHVERSVALHRVKAAHADLASTLAATRARSASLADALAKARQEAAEAKAALAAASVAPSAERAPAAKPAPAKRKPVAVPVTTAPAPLFRNPFGG